MTGAAMSYYVVIRRDREVDVRYYCGRGQWSVLRSEAAVFRGAQASVLCEHLSTREGIAAVFVLA
jgi:hypothetical protein